MDNHSTNRIVEEDFIQVMMFRFKYDLTKRQCCILTFIWTLSWAFGKEKAIIPRLQDFEVCGVSATKIKSELDRLLELNIIFHNPKENSYSVNWNTDEWKAPINQKWDYQRGKELVDLNKKDRQWL